MSTAAFDRIAARYDELWTTTAIGRAQRDAVWCAIDPLFRAGDRILDIGCGTGEDAVHFTARGVTVHAIDPSRAMVAVAQSRGGFTAEVRSAENLQRVGGTFDGAISNFGALNCVEDLPAVAPALGALVRPGGRVAICTIGRFCAWEMLYYAARLNFRKAFRRLGGSSSFHAITVRYPTVRQLRASFSADFELQRWTGIGMLVPPSYVRLPAPVVKLLASLDRLPLLRAIADHRLLIFVRK
jgi:ubiquinone/menaquinone biosynthesis C-methylase UbiE